jgi:3-hydroxyisobutyrate dehydrogenase-like beta-hydroxyacid dehydrogenase
MAEIGICGAGVMGRAAIGQLVQAGCKVHFFEVSASARSQALALGAEGVDSPAALMKLSEVVLLFLPGPAEVIRCVSGDDGLLSAAGSKTAVIVDMSTVDPDTSTILAKAARQTGIGYLDAPVLGRPQSVGKWALPVGGRAADLEKARPALQIVADRIFHIGASGTGNRVKLLNQLMFGAINAMTAEMMAIAEENGIAPKLLYDTITASQAATVSNLFKELGRRIAENDYSDPTFTVDLLVKDVRLAVQMADQGRTPPLLGRVVDFFNATAQAQGFGNRDTSEMWKSIQKLWRMGS